jgi:hypothetical protein
MESISLGTVFVAGKNLVPRPAAGIIAFFIFAIAIGFRKTLVEGQLEIRLILRILLKNQRAAFGGADRYVLLLNHGELQT